jgi:hypothetical protein
MAPPSSCVAARALLTDGAAVLRKPAATVRALAEPTARQAHHDRTPGAWVASKCGLPTGPPHGIACARAANSSEPGDPKLESPTRKGFFPSAPRSLRRIESNCEGTAGAWFGTESHERPGPPATGRDVTAIFGRGVIDGASAGALPRQQQPRMHPVVVAELPMGPVGSRAGGRHPTALTAPTAPTGDLERGWWGALLF